MNIYDISFEVPTIQKQESTSVGESIKGFLREVGTFVYETPLWIVASLVAGIVLLIFFPIYSIPFLTLAGAAILTRLTIKIIVIHEPQGIKSFQEKFYQFQEEHSYIQYLAFVISVAASIPLPILGGIFSGALGIYKGMVVEIDVLKYKQEVKKEELKHPPLDSKVKIISV